MEEVVTGLNKQVGVLLETSQLSFFKAFRDAMDKITEELKDLKEKYKMEKIRLKQDEEYIWMQKESKWFRDECIRLNILTKKQAKKYEDLKEKLNVV